MGDLINRHDAIEAMCSTCGYDCDEREFVYNAPRDEQVIMCPEHYALSTLPSTEPERHYCRECKWSRCHINLDKYGRSEMYWHCLNWDGGTDEEGFCHEWERKTDEQTD